MAAALTGKTLFVTGANRGIGAAFLDAAFDRGAAKVYAAARDVDSLAQASVRFGDRLLPVELDLTAPETLDAAAAACPDVDLLINNAGRTCIRPILDPDGDDAVRNTMEINYFGPLRLTRAFAPTLTQRQGGVIFVLSMAGLLPAPVAPAYSASKAAAEMAAHGLRFEMADSGVTVSLVYPGFVDTRMSDGFELGKASPLQIAERSLDGWCAGETSIFPDVFAEMTRDALATKMDDILRDPQGVVNDLVTAFAQRPDAGS